ncbi:hypothetical protein ACN42_g7542 [Penicillium freii]|uniref:Uncharacterized protein n=1 Tax=Penicillium freii TaxID=48697 RepID=A0A101MFR5_PENFR|nr:hypothetical protein ACN42_g7542 [Penicillium freii]
MTERSLECGNDKRSTLQISTYSLTMLYIPISQPIGFKFQLYRTFLQLHPNAIYTHEPNGPSKTDNGRKEIPKITHRGIKSVNVHRIPNSNFKTIEPFSPFPMRW